MAGAPDEAVTAPLAQQARDWLLRLASGTMDEAAMQAFEQWLALPGHRRAFEYERVLWRSLASRPVQRQVRRATLLRRLLPAAVAATFIAVAIGPGLALWLRADYNAVHGVEQVALPDGSTAVLDAGSAIAIHYRRDVRRVELLRGRAWFNVAAGPQAPFRVTVGEGVVEDISTAFVVSRSGDHVDAVVEQGMVRLAAMPGQGWMYLRSGQQAGWDEAGVATLAAAPAAGSIAPWRYGELLLQGMAVGDALAELDRYRPGSIIVRGDLSALPRINAALRIVQPDEALDTLAASSGLTVTRLPLGVALVQRATVVTPAPQ